MIGAILQFGNDFVTVEVKGTDLLFRTSEYNSMSAPIESLKLSKAGVVKEFPDLADAEDWKQKAIERLKTKIKDMATEIERINYVITDLKSYGYIPYAYQKQGHRVNKFKGEHKVE